MVKKRVKRRSSQLKREIERSVTPDDTDRLDTDVLSYVDHLLSHELELKPLEPITLMTEQQALRALDHLNQTRGLVQEKLQKVQALRRLLKA